jgi:6-pyruvoyl-tetrahydropterin synthase
MSICHCLISGVEKENEEKLGFVPGLNLIKKAFRYQLKDNDISHLMDMSDFFKKNQELCVSDVTSNF